jgi:hypothetical protein
VPQNRPDSLIENLFSKPNNEYAPVPWWAWAGALEPELLERQLRQMRSQGLTEFFIFPIYGMDVEFMSPEYIDRIRMVIGWCKELGMRLWIYDELNWPSGVAAGLVPRKHPEAVASQIHIERHENLSPDELGSLLNERSVIWAVQVLPDGSLRPIDKQAPPGGRIDVIAFRRKQDQIASLPVRGCLWTRNDPGLLDILSASAVRAFIEEAYEPIARAFPEELGRTIRGFFTDEPQFAPGAIPWTDGLPEEFMKRFGYDIVPHLHRLVFDDPDCDRVRIDFWSLIADLASSNYTGQLADWCAEHNMVLTGHMVQEENSYSVWWNGDVPSHLLKMQVPGCDLLTLATNYSEPEEWYVYGGKSLIKSAKNPGSAARYTGAKRVLCEAYGVLPWWKAPEHEKHLTDWLVALGVNMINDNSLITDICDFRKRAISGKHFTQPYWVDEHIYYEYAARICGLAAETALDTQLLVLYPSTTWWAGVRGGTDTSEALREMEVAFDVTCDALVRRHWHYEHLYEQILESASVEDGVLVTSGGRFQGVVLAGINRIRPQHAAKLEQFADSGGAVFLVGSEVTVVEHDKRRPLRVGASARLDHKSPTFYDDLDRAISERLARPWRISGPGSTGVISSARIDQQGGRYLFMANMTPGDKELEISWDGTLKVEMWDADTGTVWTPQQESGRLSFVLPEGQSVWLAQTKAPVSHSRPPIHFIVSQDAGIELGGSWRFSTDRPNLFSLDCRLLVDLDGNFEPESVLSQSGWIQLNDGDSGVPLRPENMKYYWLSADFTVEEGAADIHLVVDTDYVQEAWLNGRNLGASRPITVWDEHNRTWDFGEHLKMGRNSLLLRVRPSPYNAEHVAIFPVSIVEPVVLRGSFSVSDGGALAAPVTALEIGDWGKQGLPHFAGVGIYANEFSWPGGDAAIDVNAGSCVVEVLVDGRSLGKRAWGSRKFLAAGLQPGTHTIEIRVTNTLAGILRRYYGAEKVSEIPACGLLSPVKITHSNTNHEES